MKTILEYQLCPSDMACFMNSNVNGAKGARNVSHSAQNQLFLRLERRPDSAGNRFPQSRHFVWSILWINIWIARPALRDIIPNYHLYREKCGTEIRNTIIKLNYALTEQEITKQTVPGKYSGKCFYIKYRQIFNLWKVFKV